MPDGRFAPTPSGPLHVGNLRTALIAWLFARGSASRFRLRIDDLDPSTWRPDVAAAQVRDLRRLGLDWDGPVVSQRDRAASGAYEDAIAGLVARDLTYPCYCSRREIREAAAAPHGPVPEGAYPGTCRDLDVAGRRSREADGRPPALRLRTDGGSFTVIDRRHGPVTVRLDDLVLRRNDGTAAYNLAVVVDDAFQEIGEVVRADDLLLSTPRQAYLASLLGVAGPGYAHVPLVLGPDGTRLAKRGEGTTLDELVAAGQSPADVRARLATSLDLAEPGEPVTMAELVERFDADRLPREPWIFD